ncbi:MAG: DUF4249 family protein [Bacteroidetes bacterium]|nr:MAG: DUF4249 family protein [Bacteroidota bacterium]
MKKITYSLLVLVIAISSACEKIVTNVDVPKVESQMVLFGFISPEEDNIRVELTLSKPIFASNSGNGLNAFEPITDANVIITNENGQAVTLNFADSINAYQVSQSVYKIEPGKTYTITAVSPTRSVKAMCTVPIDTVSLTGLTITDWLFSSITLIRPEV